MMWFRGQTSGWIILVLLALGVFTSPALAQFREADVEIELDQFGLGGSFRPGEVVPMRLRLLNNPAGRLDEAVMVWVQWEVPNADGDIGEYGRALTLTRGRPTPVWLYAPVPPAAQSDTVWAVRVFEMRDGERRSEISGRRIRPADVNSRAEPLGTSKIAVIGQRQLGLNQYGAVLDERPHAAHESTRIAFGIRPDQLPDRWEGLSTYEAIVWGTDRESQPQALTSDTASSLREYVRFGGHLVIVLPEDANPWQFGRPGQTALDDLLPRREPRKDAASSVMELLPVVSKSRQLPQGVRDLGVRVFKDLYGTFNVIEPPYEPLIALPDGRVIAIQRMLGHGRITVIGLDLAQLTPLALPHPDVFWNRVLGRRIDTPSASELHALREERLLAAGRGANEIRLGADGLITQQIAMDGPAGLGLMLALLLFATYWALAGPGGFAMLKFYKRTHHAWIAFAGAAAAFTAIAWGSVAAMRINEPRIEHVTYLDHIVRPDDAIRDEDPQYQRAVSWFSLYTPGYARSTVSLESDRNVRNILMPWTPPGEHMQAFPNPDRFTVNVSESPFTLNLPSRSTSTNLTARWLGGLDPDWGGMIRPEVDAAVRVILDTSRREDGLAGRLVHYLPESLMDVTVIWVRNQRLTPRQYQLSDGVEQHHVPRLSSGQMANLGRMWRVPRWDAGESLDLGEFRLVGVDVDLAEAIKRRYVDEYSTQRSTAGAPMRESDRTNYMEMLSFFNQLTPPEYLKTRADERDPENVFFQRRLGRELDLSPWLTRPCLIVIGFLRDSEIPVPVQVGANGRAPQSTGVTIVRWVYPLPLLEDIAFPAPRDEDEYPF